VLVGFDEREFFMTFPHLSRISWVLGTIYGPFVFFFISRLTGAAPKQKWMLILLWIPLLVVLSTLIPYFLQSAEEKRLYLSEFEKSLADDFGWINQFVSLVQIFFVFFNLTFYLRWERDQSEEFSAPDAVRVKWLRQFLLFLVFITTFGVVVFFARLFNIEWLGDLYRFHFIGVVFLFYWLSYKALTQPVLFGIAAHSIPVEKNSEAATDDKYRKSGVDPQQLQAAFQKVKATLVDNRLYLKSDLTLTELSEKSSLPRHLVSQAINTFYNGNFFDLVNDYRVEEFKRQAMSPEKKHLNLLGIALESGFNSKASFYGVFKKKTGLTPSEYIEKQQKAA
jgi:AraC-like DNA-binding protein